MAIPRLFGVYGRSAVAVSVVALAGCSGQSDANPPANPVRPAVQPKSAPSFPTSGFGGTYRNVHLGVNINSEWEVTLEAGLAAGPFGVSVPVLKFSGKEGSFEILLDPSPELNLELGKRTLKWSRPDGFGQDIGTKFPMLKGKLVADIKTEGSKLGGKSPAIEGLLTTSGGRLAFIPTQPAGLNHDVIGRKPNPFLGVHALAPLNVNRLLGEDKYVPDLGYEWVDGTSEGRKVDSVDLRVRWKPGQKVLLLSHVQSAQREGFWEPETGYVWTDGSDAPRRAILAFGSTVRWEPGRPWPGYPGVVSGSQEGMVAPAPGYDWETVPPVNFRVRRVIQPFGR